MQLGNSGEPGLASAARRHLDDPSPLVRAMAVWALSRLMSPENFAAARKAHLPGETDRDVRDEWLGPAA